MEQYLCKKRVVVTEEKHLRLDGITTSYKKGGILNFPEEEPDTEFYVKKTGDGFVLSHDCTEGYPRKTRKSGCQTVINVGRVIDESCDFKCYKTDDGYRFEKIVLEGVGTGKSILYLHKNNVGDYYVCIPVEYFKKIKAKKGDYLKITYNICENLSIIVEKAEEKGECVNTVKKRVGYVLYEGRTKSLAICRRTVKYLNDTDALAIIPRGKKLTFVKYPKIF